MFCENNLNFGIFISDLRSVFPLAAVTVNDIRDVINVTSAEISDAAVLKMVKRAEVTLALELGKEIDYQDCSEAEKEFITILAAIYAICYLTGGSAVGLNFKVGDQNISLLENIPPLEVLRAELDRILERLREIYVRSV